MNKKEANVLYQSAPNKRGFSYQINKHIPTEAELAPYRGSTKEPYERIKNLMKNHLREEQLLASKNFKNFADILFEISERVASEKIRDDVYSFSEMDDLLESNHEILDHSSEPNNTLSTPTLKQNPLF